MSHKDENKKLEAKLEYLIDLEKKFDSLTSFCKDALTKIDDNERKLQIKEIQLKIEYEKKFKDLLETEKSFNKIIQEKTKGLPWLASAIAEFINYKDVEISKFLERKTHPSIKGAEAVRAKAAENRILRKQIRIAASFVNYYETIAPWLMDYRDEDLIDLLKNIENESKEEKPDQDPVLEYVPKSDYKILSEEERSQRALDRYMGFKKKSSWRLGRDYERYIGFLYEKKGYKVSYEGIIKGFEDLGRDLICVNDKEIEIVQCKYWAKYKQIHEKHINQLYGTVVKYYIDHKELVNPKGKLAMLAELIKNGEINATFVTSTTLSPTAMQFAEALGIKVEQEKPIEKYPVIKCNIAASGERIFHLPFDQQYDKTVISKDGEFYAMTIKEAMEKGFRRAFQWSGA